MWFMILMLALAGAFAASMQSNDLLLLGLAAAVGAAIGFAAYDIPRRATAAIAPGFVGGPFMRWFANLVRAFAGVMADIALWLTVAVSALFLWAMWKSSGYDQATILAKFVACFGASMAFFSCLFGMLVALLIDNNWFGQAQRFRPNLVFGLFTGLVIPALFLLNEVLPMVRKSIGA